MLRKRRAVGFLLSMAMAACRSPTSPRTAKPNVVLVTIDTLRADHLSCYGYAKPTSPFLDRLAAEGVRFENAYAVSSWTAPSMASLFTALYPRQHGVRHGVVEEKTIVRQEYLDDRFLTLAELMKAAGYETFAVLSNGHTSRETGFARGFDYFQMLWFQECPVPNEVVAKWLPRLRKGCRPFFLWIHYFDPHAPYTAHSEWLRKHSADLNECARWLGLQMRDLRKMIAELRTRPAAQTALVDLYDGEIHWCDRIFSSSMRCWGRPTTPLSSSRPTTAKNFLNTTTSDMAKIFSSRPFVFPC